MASAAPALAAAPAPTTAPPSPVTQTSATLNGSVNPNGAEVTKCEFGAVSVSEKSAPCSPLSPGKGTSPVPVTGAATGLSPNTTYKFRLAATNEGGKGEVEGSFKTLPPNAPTVKTEPASSVTQTSAVLSAAVNDNGNAFTACRFEYGPTTAYGSAVACPSVSGEARFSIPIAGLAPNTTFHFRI